MKKPVLLVVLGVVVALAVVVGAWLWRQETDQSVRGEVRALCLSVGVSTENGDHERYSPSCEPEGDHASEFRDHFLRQGWRAATAAPIPYVDGATKMEFTKRRGVWTYRASVVQFPNGRTAVSATR